MIGPSTYLRSTYLTDGPGGLPLPRTPPLLPPSAIRTANFLEKPADGRARIYAYAKFSNLTIFGRTDLRISLSEAKFDEEADFDVRSAIGPPKSSPN